MEPLPTLHAFAGCCGVRVLTAFPFRPKEYSKKDWRDLEKHCSELLSCISTPFVFATLNSSQTPSEELLLRLGFRALADWRFNYAKEVKPYIWENPRSPERKREYQKHQEERGRLIEQWTVR